MAPSSARLYSIRLSLIDGTVPQASTSIMITWRIFTIEYHESADLWWFKSSSFICDCTRALCALNLKIKFEVPNQLGVLESQDENSLDIQFASHNRQKCLVYRNTTKEQWPLSGHFVQRRCIITDCSPSVALHNVPVHSQYSRDTEMVGCVCVCVCVVVVWVFGVLNISLFQNSPIKI